MLRLAVVGLAALFVILGIRPSPAADTRNIAYAPVPMDAWIVTVKAHVITSPRWTGSDEQGLFAYPSLSFRKASEKPRWSSPDDGITIDGMQMAGITLAPVFKYRAGRYDGQHRELRGIHDARWTLEGGVAASTWLGQNVRARVELRRGFRAKDGFEASFGTDFVKSFRSWTVAIGPRLAIADASFMRNHFGVTPLDALRNPRVTAYKPQAGIKSVGLYASATYDFNQTWSATLHGGYDRLVGQAAKSPIVTRLGSPNQYRIGLTLAYSFPVNW
jgi:outer membrane scaffolding protein for murein synthesis (MipA/OmpV family)